MFEYVKNLIAVGVAVFVLASAFFWFQSRHQTRRELTQKLQDNREQLSAIGGYAMAIAELDARQVAADQRVRALRQQFVENDRESQVLLSMVVQSASRSGLEMTHAGKVDRPGRSVAIPESRVTVNVLSYGISLRGSYEGCVKFLQALSAWRIQHHIDSLKLSAPDPAKMDGTVEMELILSIYSMAS